MHTAAAKALNIFILSFIGTVVPFLLWAAHRFQKNKSHQIMSYRDPTYVLTVVIVSILGMISVDYMYSINPFW